EHPLPAREVTQERSLCRRLERERELLRLPGRPGDRLRPEDEAELPQELAARATEAVAGAALDERLQAVVRERCAAGEIGHVAKATVALALGDERFRVVLPDRADVRDPDPNRGRRAL